MTTPPTGIYYDPKYKDPCLSCHHRDQACANITNGMKYEDACMSKRIWMKHQEKKRERTQQPEPKHCGHECNGQVCEKYNTLHFEGGQFDEPCSLGNICDYDTRARGPVPAEQTTLSENDPCLKCQIFLKGSHQCDGNPCGVKLDHSRKEHDTLIAARATKNVLDAVEPFVDVETMEIIKEHIEFTYQNQPSTSVEDITPEGATDGLPHVVTDVELKACWSGVPNAFLFRCKICGHVFVKGDTFRFIFGSHKRNNVGNVLVCSNCDSGDERCLRAIHPHE